MNMFARFYENPAMTLQDIKETKRYGRTQGRTHARSNGQRENSIPTINKVCRGYNNKFYCSATNGFNILQDALNEVYVSSIKYHYSGILLKKQISFILFTEYWILTELSPHATELIFLRPVQENKRQLFHT